MFRSFKPLVYHFFFNATATTELYTLSLHDALPISTDFPRFSMKKRVLNYLSYVALAILRALFVPCDAVVAMTDPDRKSTRLNSSHVEISYAVFCLKKKKNGKDSSTKKCRLNVL